MITIAPQTTNLLAVDEIEHRGHDCWFHRGQADATVRLGCQRVWIIEKNGIQAENSWAGKVRFMQKATLEKRANL